jgi:hypothetical protein
MAMNVARLTLESQQVIALRMAKLAMGGSAGDREAKLMIAEKIDAFRQAGFAASSLALAGHGAPAIATEVIRSYRKRVRSNAKRLSKPSR